MHIFTKSTGFSQTAPRRVFAPVMLVGAALHAGQLKFPFVLGYAARPESGGALGLPVDVDRSFERLAHTHTVAFAT
jgi:hypothetical protein